MRAIERSIRQRGGLATTAQLLADKHILEQIHMDARYGIITHVCKGWWATNNIPEFALQARRAGGRLACVGALAYLGMSIPYEWLDTCHVSIERSASRHVGAAKLEQNVFFHWSRQRLPGDDITVDREIAIRQLKNCRALAARAGLSREAWRAIALDRVYDR